MQTIQTITPFIFDLPTQAADFDESAVIELYSAQKQHLVQIGNTNYLIIGNDNGYELGVSVIGKQVFTVSEKTLCVDTFVNSNVASLLTFINKYQAVIRQRTDDDDKRRALLSLWQELKRIDFPALSSVDQTWWGEFLHDKLLMFGAEEKDFAALEM